MKALLGRKLMVGEIVSVRPKNKKGLNRQNFEVGPKPNLTLD